MALTVKHAFVSAKGDGPDASKVQPSHWNAEHQITGTGTMPVGATTSYDGHTVPAGWLECYGQNVSRVAYALLFAALVKSSPVTITFATPAVVNWPAHGFLPGSKVRFTTNGTLPAPLAINTDYFVLPSGLAADFFQLSATNMGAAIATTAAGSGVHTGIYAPHGVGDGSSTFGIPDRRDVVDVGRGNMGGVDRGLFTGAFFTNTLGFIGGTALVTLDVNTMPAHVHGATMSGGVTGGGDHGHGWAVGSAGLTGTPWLVANGSCNALSPAHTHGYGKPNPTGSSFASPGAGSAFKGLVYNNPISTEESVSGGGGLGISGSCAINAAVTITGLGVSVTGTVTGVGAHSHGHNIAATIVTNGGGAPHVNVQPSFATRKIIFAGV